MNEKRIYEDKILRRLNKRFIRQVEAMGDPQVEIDQMIEERTISSEDGSIVVELSDESVAEHIKILELGRPLWMMLEGAKRERQKFEAAHENKTARAMRQLNQPTRPFDPKLVR